MLLVVMLLMVAWSGSAPIPRAAALRCIWLISLVFDANLFISCANKFDNFFSPNKSRVINIPIRKSSPDGVKPGPSPISLSTGGFKFLSVNISNKSVIAGSAMFNAVGFSLDFITKWASPFIGKNSCETVTKVSNPSFTVDGFGGGRFSGAQTLRL